MTTDTTHEMKALHSFIFYGLPPLLGPSIEF
jgi:hypothetical protein